MTGVVTNGWAPLARRMLRASLRLVRPIIAFNYVAGAPTRLAAGVPDDASNGLIEGPHLLHLLVVGGLSGSSVGVRSFELGVAHQCAKSLAAGEPAPDGSAAMYGMVGTIPDRRQVDEFLVEFIDGLFNRA